VVKKFIFFICYSNIQTQTNKLIFFALTPIFCTLRIKKEYLDWTRNTHWKKRKINFPRKPEWLGSNLGLVGHPEIGFGEMGFERRN